MLATHVIDKGAVLGCIFPQHVVVQLDRVGLVVLDREPRIYNEGGKLFPLHRSIPVDINLREKLAQVGNKLQLGQIP